MLTNSVFRLPVRGLRALRRTSAALPTARPSVRPHVPVTLRTAATASSRAFHVSSKRLGLMPESENPPPREAEPHEEVSAATELDYEEYHQRSDQFLEALVEKLEQIQEEKSEVEVEYAAGVLTVEVAGKGTYVLNKQPPNKQIWLSSPITGPKRFDWVVTGESMGQKEGSGQGDWVYIRDGTSLTELLRKELGVDVGIDSEHPDVSHDGKGEVMSKGETV